MRPNEQNARSEAEILLGDYCSLLQQVGFPGLAPDAPEPFWSSALETAPGLGQFLEDYFSRLLLPCELPAIVTAFGHARRGEWRDLLAQDQRLAAHLVPTPFAEPSRRMGSMQLARLRPLRDHRIVQRYLAAVESGQAHGWHTLVYGVTLSVYSLPMRQGLLYYSQETLLALASAAARSGNFSQAEPDELLSSLLARIPEAVEAALAANHCGELLPKA